jgi:hypothetical protein
MLPAAAIIAAYWWLNHGWLALLLQLNFLFGYLLWRQAGYSLAVQSR